MRHVAAHRWAEAASGHLDADERAKMAAHAASCERCATARARVLRARESFASIADAPSPELRWEHIGARVYWSTSQERRAVTGRNVAIRQGRRWWLIPAFVTVAAGAAASAWITLRPSQPIATAKLTAPAPHLDITPIDLVNVPDPTPIVGLVTLTQGDVTVATAHDATALFAQPVVAGTPITTGEGRVAVQLDGGTAFAIGPHSRLAIVRLDSGEIQLDVDGSISVEVSHRAPDQRFVVVAGDRTVEVRGTQFEVVHERNQTSVSCRRGLVAVRDAGSVTGGTVEVAAGTHWAAADDEPLTRHDPAPLDASELAAMAAREPLRLPAWTSTNDELAILHTSAPLAIGVATGHEVRIDGIVMGPGGSGELAVRVMSGRHLVETERGHGRFAPGQWIATRDDGTPARVEAPAQPAADRGAGVAKRRGQLDGEVDRSRMQSCLRTLVKQGIAEGTHVDVEIGVDATGAVSFLNVVDTDLPAPTAACVRDVVAQVEFPAGAKATWRHRFRF